MQTADASLQFDDETGPHPPELYTPSGVAEGLDGWDAVDEQALVRYHEQGYLVVHRAFTQEEVNAGLEGLVGLVSGKCPEFKNISFEAKAREILPTLSPEQKQDAVRKLMSFTRFDAGLKRLAEHPRLLGVVQRILEGPHELFQEMALIKPPRLGREKPWHQDHSYFDLPIDTRIIGVWIALDEATIENGCMHIMPGWHKTPRVHFTRRDWQLCDSEILGRKCLAVPLKPGGCLFFDGKMPHGTPPNTSSHRRRAVQYHYIPAQTKRTTKQERMAIFGSEGKDVTC